MAEETVAMTVRDSSWVGRSFLLSNNTDMSTERNKEMVRWKKWTSANVKFTGTGLGLNTVLNAAPAFTPTADIPIPGLTGGKAFRVYDGPNFEMSGMGARYSEAIDDNKQVVHMRFGVPKYKGLITFFTSFYDSEAATIAKYGRSGIGYYFGRVLGLVITFPLLYLGPVILAGKAWQFFTGRQSSRYFDFKQTMPLYWTRMQVIYNNLGANIGIIPRMFDNTGHWGKGADTFNDLDEGEGTESYKAYMAKTMPRMFKKGRFDVIEVAQNPSRLESAHREAIDKIAAGAANKSDLRKAILDYIENKKLVASQVDATTETNLTVYLNSVLGKISELSLETDGIEDTMSQAIDDQASGRDPNALENIRQKMGGEATPTDGSTPPPDTAPTTGTPAPATGTPAGGTTGVAQSAVNNAVGQITGKTQIPPVTIPPAVSGLVPTPPGEFSVGKALGIDIDIYKNPQEKGQIPYAPGKGPAAAANAEGKPTEVTPGGAVANDGNTQNTAAPSSDLEKSISKNGQEFMNVVKTKAGEAKDGAAAGFDWVTGWFSQAGEAFVHEARNGSAFVNIEAVYTGAGTASFSSTLKEPTISGVLNGVAGAARDARVSLSDYQTGFGFIDAATNMARNVFGGVMDSVQLSGLMALAGNAFIDFPKTWDDSTATFPTATFRAELRSWSGNEFSSYFNLYPVVAALLAGALPQSTGPQSYTSPNLVECYSRGFCAIRVGMITELTITAGAGNLGYDGERRPLAFDVSWTVADLSSIAHAPVANGFNPLSPMRRVMDDDNATNDYFSVITGVHMRDMIDSRRKFAIRAAARWMDYKAMLSPGQVGARLGSTGVVQTVNRLFGNSSFPGV